MNQNLKFKIQNSQSGFTLIEMLMVIVVTTMIATISIANFRSGEKQKRVALAADIVVNAIRNSQIYSLTGKKINDPNPVCRAPQYYYSVFRYSLNEFYLRGYSSCNTDNYIETYTLPGNTRIKASGLVLNGTAVTDNLGLYFTTPYGASKATVDNGSLNSFNTATITVESSDGAASKTVTIDGVAGRIGE